MDLTPEIKYRFTRSQGPGGQSVNKVNTRVELVFNVHRSDILLDSQKEKILKNLENRVSKEGIIRLSSQKGRTQIKNRALVTQRFYELIREALANKPKRLPTKPGKSSKEKRLNEKKRVSQKKQDRKKPDY
jgi:ribosome-associated protein